MFFQRGRESAFAVGVIFSITGASEDYPGDAFNRVRTGCVKAYYEWFYFKQIGWNRGKTYSRPFSVTGKRTGFFMRKEIRNDQSNS